MNEEGGNPGPLVPYPVDVVVENPGGDRNRLTVGFRFILGIPHILLVGSPIGLGLGWALNPEGTEGLGSTSGTGVLGAVAFVCAVIAWFAILFTGRHPNGLWNLAAFYMRWRVRAVTYMALLRDEYPPFGEGDYPVRFSLARPPEARNRLTVGFRILLAIPHMLAIAILWVAWFLTTVVAWFAILFTGRFPDPLYGFSLGVMRWSTRLEAYLLLLTDEYPPFSFQ